MIRQLRVQNFRCLRDVSVDLGPLTVFVGPNGSGKTAFADVLAPQRAAVESDFWCKDAPFMRLSWERANGDSSDLEVKQPGTPFHVHRLQSRRQLLRPASLKRHNLIQEAEGLDPTGENLVSAFDTLTRKSEQAFVAEFCALVPYYRDVLAKPSEKGHKRLVFQDRWHESLWFEPNEVSDGTILAFAFLFLARHQPDVELMVIEDPDHGLHPYLVGEVVSLLRKLANGELGGRAIQVVLTTHSASLLNHMEADEVRFLSRDIGTGETRVQPAPSDDPKWQSVYDEYQRSLGELWLSGALGGVPGS